MFSLICLLRFGLLLAALGGPLGLSAPVAAAQRRAAVLDGIQRVFQNKSPDVQDCTLLQIQPVHGKTKRYLVLAHGIRVDKRFSGSFEDELFGLFVVDEGFVRIQRVIDVFPTRRWNDYSVTFAISDHAVIVVTCQGSTYGDEKEIKKYSVRLLYD